MKNALILKKSRQGMYKAAVPKTKILEQPQIKNITFLKTKVFRKIVCSVPGFSKLKF